MSADPVISVENVSKAYRVGSNRSRPCRPLPIFRLEEFKPAVIKTR